MLGFVRAERVGHCGCYAAPPLPCPPFALRFPSFAPNFFTKWREKWKFGPFLARTRVLGLFLTIHVGSSASSAKTHRACELVRAEAGPRTVFSEEFILKVTNKGLPASPSRAPFYFLKRITGAPPFPLFPALPVPPSHPEPAEPNSWFRASQVLGSSCTESCCTSCVR